MPAPYSKLRPENKAFAPVDVPKRIFKLMLKICLKMPKRYTYLLLQDTLSMARKVRDYTKVANSVFPTNKHEAQIRIDYWIRARAALQALSSSIDDFLDTPDTLTYKDETSHKTKGITVHELEQISDLINEEQALLTAQLQKEHKKLETYS